MKLKELIELVDKSAVVRLPKNSECEVVIATSNPSIGGRKMVAVSGVAIGFDWEKGNFILQLNEPVYTRTQEEEIKSLREQLDSYAWENHTLKGENKKLKSQLKKES